MGNYTMAQSFCQTKLSAKVDLIEIKPLTMIPGFDII